MTESDPMAKVDAPAKPKRRRRSGTASFHLSSKAVDISVKEVLGWTERKCIDYLVSVRFGSWKTVQCPYCGTIGPHCWKKPEKRWRCTGCRSSFSITAGTVFRARKLPLQEIVAATLTFVSHVGGRPALALRRELRRSYNAAYVHQQKLREGVLRGHNVGLLNGDVEMDAAHQSGRRAAEKRGRPQITQSLNADPDKTKKAMDILAQAGAGGANAASSQHKPLTNNEKRKARYAAKGGVIDPDFGRRLPPQRRFLFVVRQRSGVRGYGAVATRVGVGRAEDIPQAKSMVTHYVAVPESVLNSDTVNAYERLGKAFMAHRTVEHSKMLRGPNGENNNQAEEFNWRYDRAEKGMYLNIEPKYLQDYASEVAFRSDTRRLSNGKQLRLLLHVAMSVGPSLFWTGFTHGRHRDFEFLHPENQEAPSSGPPKGHNPISMQNGRPPR